MKRARVWTAGAATAALLAVSACTASGTHSRPGAATPGATSSAATTPAVASPSASPSAEASPSAGPRAAGPAPIAAATLQALASVSVGTTITPVTGPRAMRAAVPRLARSEAAAIRAALEYDRRGSRVVGVTLAWVTMDGPGFNQRPRLVWLVSVDPYGGAFVEGLPVCGSYDYLIDFIDPASGRVLVGTADSHARGLRPLPVIGPVPDVTPGTGCHLGPP